MTCSTTSLILSFSLLSLLLSFSSAAQTLTKAAAILSDSGYNSMSVALGLASHSLTSHSPSSLTVFSPADSAFSSSGQPALNLLRLHLIPAALPLLSLKALPPGTKIPTLLAGHSLTVTTRPGDRHVSLNNVTVAAPIFDDGGSFVVYGIQSFFLDQIWSPIECGVEPTEPNPLDEWVTWPLFWHKLLPMAAVGFVVVRFMVYLLKNIGRGGMTACLKVFAWGKRKMVLRDADGDVMMKVVKTEVKQNI